MSVKELFTCNVEETPIPQEFPISGTLPKWLTGTHYKIGAGKFKLPSGFEVGHYYDGYGIIYQYKIEDGKVWFRSKYLNSVAYTEAMEVGKPTFGGVGTRQYPNPNKNVFSRIISSVIPIDVTDDCSTNIFVHNDQIYAAAECQYLHHIDPESLQSVAKLDFQQCGIVSTGCHWLNDETGASYNTGSTLLRGKLKSRLFEISPNAHGSVIDPNKDVKLLTSLPQLSMTTIAHSHSFGMTKNYFVVIEHSLKANLLSFLMGQIQGKTAIDCLSYNKDEKTKFHVIDRATNRLIKINYQSEAFCFYHLVNAYEEDGHLILDISIHKDLDLVRNLSMENLKNSESFTTGKLKRFVLPLTNIEEANCRENLVKLDSTNAKAVKVNTDQVLLAGDTLTDLPLDEVFVINKKFVGRKYRYIYSLIVFNKHPLQKHLIKLDLETKEIKSWKSSNENHFATEPYFVPNPDGTDEDDGIIVAAVAEVGRKQSMLVFLDGKSFTEIARADINCQINVALHGVFIF